MILCLFMCGIRNLQQYIAISPLLASVLLVSCILFPCMLKSSQYIIIVTVLNSQLSFKDIKIIRKSCYTCPRSYHSQCSSFFAWVQFSICHHFPSACMMDFTICCNAGLLVVNFFSFCLSRKVFVSSLFDCILWI